MSLRSLALAIATALLPGCHCALTFHTQERGEMTIPRNPNPLGGVLDLPPAVSGLSNIDFNQNQDFRNQGVSKDHVDSVKVQSVKLQITSPGNQGFDFLDTLQFLAKTGDQQVEVAHKSSIRQLGLDPPNPVLNMDVTHAELKPYLTAPSMSIVAAGHGSYPQNDTTLAITVDLAVVVGL